MTDTDTDTGFDLDAEVAVCDQLRFFGRTDRARQGLARVLAADPQHPAALSCLSTLHLEEEEYEDSARAARLLIAHHPQDPAGHICLALALTKLGDPVTAQDAARCAVRLDPYSAPAHVALARAVADADQLNPEAAGDAALEILREAAALDPDWTTVHSERVKVHYGRYEFAEAEAAARLALRLEPESAVFLVFLGCTLLRQARDEEAVQVLGQALRLLPGRSSLSLIEEAIRKLAGVPPVYAELHRQVTQALGLPPAGDEDLDDEALAQRLYERGMHPFRAYGVDSISTQTARECAALFQRALDLDPSHTGPLVMLLELLHEHGPLPPEWPGQPPTDRELTERHQMAKALARHWPENAAPNRIRLISLAALTRDWCLMASEAFDAYQADPEDWAYSFFEAHAHLLMGLPLEAAAAARRGLEIETDNADCTLLLGLAQRRAGFTEEATATLARACDLVLATQHASYHRQRAKRFSAGPGAVPDLREPGAARARLRTLAAMTTVRDPARRACIAAHCTAEADLGIHPEAEQAHLRQAAALLEDPYRDPEAAEAAARAHYQYVLDHYPPVPALGVRATPWSAGPAGPSPVPSG